jgi:hypothetical protein
MAGITLIIGLVIAHSADRLRYIILRGIMQTLNMGVGHVIWRALLLASRAPCE